MCAITSIVSKYQVNIDNCGIHVKSGLLFHRKRVIEASKLSYHMFGQINKFLNISVQAYCLFMQ